MEKALTALRGKTALLTGGTTGIGRAILAELANEGVRVLTFGRHQQPLDHALQEAGLGGDCGLVADVTNPEDLSRVFATVDERLGDLDILICNAGLGAFAIADMPDREWRYVIETNLVGYMACTKAAIERMAARGQGHIVLISSVSADIPSPGESVYAASKAGVDGFALALRQELREKGISVSVVAPGAVATEMQNLTKDQQREGIEREEILRPEDVADAVIYILTRPRRCDVHDLRIEPRMQKIPS